MFAGVAGDLSPLTIEASDGNRRSAPPALVLAMAVGLGTVDMPVPAVAEWEWLNWRFPRVVRAGDTIYARWTLTQKRPPTVGAPSSVVVWRVDVMNSEGAMCAEGEVGAKVRRAVADRRPQAEAGAAASDASASSTGAAATPARRRRRRRAANGTPETPAIAAPKPKQEPKPERAAGTSRRRRRRRPATGGARDDGKEPSEATRPEAAAPAPAAAAPSAPAATTKSRRGLGGVLRRLRRPEG